MLHVARLSDVGARFLVRRFQHVCVDLFGLGSWRQRIETTQSQQAGAGLHTLKFGLAHSPLRQDLNHSRALLIAQSLGGSSGQQEQWQAESAAC